MVNCIYFECGHRRMPPQDISIITSRLLHNLNESKVGIEGEWNENCLLITCRIDSVTDRDGEELPLSKILFDGYWLCEWLALITKNHTKRRIMVVAYLVTSNSSNHHEFKKKKKPIRITSVVMSTNSVFSSKEISSKEKFFIGNVRAIISFKLTPTRRISRASEHHIQHRRSILRDVHTVIDHSDIFIPLYMDTAHAIGYLDLACDVGKAVQLVVWN